MDDRLMDDWSMGGPSHHCAIGTGHVAGKIEKLGKREAKASAHHNELEARLLERCSQRGA